MVGIQNVIKRNTKVAEIAMPASIPAAVKPAAIAASTAPKPPGVGAACPITEPARYTKAIAAIDASVVKARTAVIKQAQYAKLRSSTPNTPVANFLGWFASEESRGSTWEKIG